MQLTRLVLIRHGQTTWNTQGRLQGQLDIPLDALGRRQAARLADALQDEGISAVVSSDLSRAWDTALALAGPLGLPLRADPGLRERCFGVLQGRTRAQIDQDTPELARRWHSREPDFAPEGAESLRAFSARCLACVRRLAAEHSENAAQHAAQNAAQNAAQHPAGSSLALVCHGGVLDSLYRAATHLALDAPRSWPLGNAVINRMLWTPQGLTLVGWNDAAHLDGIALDDPGEG